MADNHFELFGLPVGYQVDERELARRHRELMSACHPDRFAQGSAQERRLAVQKSAALNEALKVLRDPIARARYLLELAGVSTEEETDTVMDPAFLVQQMEWREALEAGHEDPAQMASLTQEWAALMAAKEQELAGQLAAGAAGHAQARRLVRELQFLRRFGDELDEARLEI
ncbi:MAG: Fe-S protein assembly co-chaperone HscB [Gammaproteobacteria bacterium]|nr:Fe-S protein assembly co-chaperone HscB [Gammaproteobacteria bacterium]